MKFMYRILSWLILFFTANSVTIFWNGRLVDIISINIILFILINIFPSVYARKLLKRELRIEADGCELLSAFTVTVALGSAFQIWMAFQLLPVQWINWLVGVIVFILVETVIFWNGIIRVYITSIQLGIRWRIIGVICGWIPVAHLIALYNIIRICFKEVSFENDKLILNENRKLLKICQTKYPLLLVHGVFFRDFRYFNYWGRVPEELQKNGAVIYYGEHRSAGSVKESGKELARRIKAIVEETGCEKVNVIAHSKGGLDMRYAISMCGCENLVSSLTTINTPHRGCLFAEYLLTKIPEKTKNLVASNYNKALRKLGDDNPDFIEAVTDLTAASCEKLNQEVIDAQEVYYQSVGSKLNYGVSGRFPLNFSYQLVKHFDGPNDGLVSDSSFIWGSKNQFLTVKGKRGISHGDMIDLNRENIEEFDVREFYVNLVSDLKARGY